MKAHDNRLRCRTTAWPLPFENERWQGRTRAEAAQLQNAWAEYLGRVQWEWFITLTFDPKKRFSASQELTSREAFSWCGFVGWVYRRPVAWVYAVERTASGFWHAHVLLIGAGQPRWLPATEAWRERNGGIDIRPVHEVRRITLYSSEALATSGEVVWSDTLSRYRNDLAPSITATLFGAETLPQPVAAQVAASESR